jgi:hypothetical protein
MSDKQPILVRCHRDTPIDDFISDIMDRALKTGNTYLVRKYGADVKVDIYTDYSVATREWYRKFRELNDF